MARRYSFAAGKVIDVPDKPKADDDMEVKDRLTKLENGDAVKALQRDLDIANAAAETFKRERDQYKAECEQLKQTVASRDQIHASVMADAKREHAAALAAAEARAAAARPMSVPAPTPAPVIQFPKQTGFVVEVTGRDGHGRLARLSITPKG